MKFITSTALFISVTLLCVSCTAKPQDGIELENHSSLIAKLKSSLQETDYSGTVLIGYKDEIIYAEGFGFADKANNIKNAVDTTYEIGSITKQFTAAAIIQLRDQGLLSVDDKIGKYFPDYKYGSDITIRHLLQMRSGIVDYLGDSTTFFVDKTFPDKLDRIYANNESFEDNLVLNHLNDSDLLFQPDVKFSYSNTNYYLLSIIIEKVSGMPYDEYIKSKIFDPLGMTNSKTGSKESSAKGDGGQDSYAVIPSNLSIGAGCISSNVIDFYKWNTALFDGEILTKSSLTEMTTCVDGYGYGFMGTGLSVEHTGLTPSFMAYCYTSMTKDYTILLFSNVRGNLGLYINNIKKTCDSYFK